MKGLSHGAASAATQTNLAASPTTHTDNPASAARVIAIVGGGFSGISVATHLLRQPTSAPLRIVIFEPRAELGAGVAYAARDYPYPLNVAAGQMSLDASNPGDFLDFARSQGVAAAAGDYLPRQLYGEYLRARFEAARSAAAAHLHAQHYRARVLQLRRTADGRWELWLDDGSAQRADEVVLALGNAPPAPLAQLKPIAGTLYCVDDPWSLGSCAHENISSVLLVGSGLTMIDAALRLAAIRPRVRNIHVLSRHGLLPEPQATESHPAIGPALDELLAPGRSMRQLSTAARGLADAIDSAGGDWRELFALLRPRLPPLWQDLGDRERARFLRHLRAYWDVHRHRVPAGPLAAVRALERLGVLEIHAGRLESLRPLDDTVEVQWRPRGAARARAWLVERVVNCTGPDSRVTRNPDPLVQASLAAGWMRPDPLDLGIDVDTDGRVITHDRAPVDSLHYVGPWLRARDWEATAVPELRIHAAQLASKLAERARESATST
jgi:uncharacterized NAD(P)/FAD-binding protein YdhS